MNETDLQNWIGRQETVHDVLDLRPAALMQSIMPQATPLSDGDALPPLWNWLYFHQPAPLDKLGRDGHPRKGGFLPPVALPRRMWAGGRFEFGGTLRIGEAVTRQSTILKVAQKTGKTGPLCFVTVEHRYLRGAQTLVREEHDIVYRADPTPDQTAPPPLPAPTAFTHRQDIMPSIVMLFRYSALTFNGHRIHYDRAYARDVEGYPDLVFHGPLTATLLAGFAAKSGGRALRSFDYRAVSPLFDSAAFEIFANLEAENCSAWACTPKGDLAMTANAKFA